MAYLLLSIISSTLIFATFKIAGKYQTGLVKLIIINYLTASVLGFLFYPNTISINEIYTSGWFPFALGLGVMFIFMFFLIGRSSQKAGVAVTTIASKMSMAIPIMFSIVYFVEPITILKLLGLILAFLAVYLCVYKPRETNVSKELILLPLIIFLGTGAIDSFLKYVQHFHVKDDQALLFSAAVFSVALILGLLYSVIFDRKYSEFIQIPVVVGGTVLGAANFGSLYFLILALQQSTFDSSIVFGINNLSIVGLSVVIGYFGFSEKMNKINLLGLLLAIVSILILTIL